ncbi:hypothetical protein HK104_009852 [Borealophlyctis nickersoniae]|nr:hypothetical protein HK104_009852 [Borealophlyctis nickersoniae]
MTHLSWDHQYEYFGKHPDFQVLLMDNRGVGESEAPNGRYTTKEMAKDIYDLLMWVGWKSDIHIVGVSMGGMISLELCLLAPWMISSLTLTSTTAGRGTPPKAAITGIPKTMVIKDAEARGNAVVEMIFPKEWLDQPTDQVGPNGEPYATNREATIDRLLQRITETKPQPRNGAVGQLLACLTHYVSVDRLKQLKSVGFPILVATGTWDNLINPDSSKHLAKHLECRLEVFQGSGHAITSEQPKRYNAMLEEHIRRAAKATTN